MANLNDGEVDLGLALGTSNQRVGSLLNNSSCTGAGAGVGVNANMTSRVDTMTFVGPGSLTELVWSTQNGLTIKCAGCSSCSADKKPCILRDVGPSEKEFSPPRDTKDENLVRDGHCVGSRATCLVGSTPLLGPSPGHTDENVGEVKCLQFIDMKHCSEASMVNVAETSEGPQNKGAADLLPLLANEPEILEGKADKFGLDIGLPLKMQDLPSSLTEHVERGEDDLKDDCGPSAPFLEKIEETDENYVQDLICKDDRKDDLVPGEESSIESSMRGQNREESSREGNERDKDDSDASMESCNSANLLLKTNKRWRFKQQLILGSKRIKKQTQDCSFFTPVVKQDSSFMNWISNVVKGIKLNQEEGHSLAVAEGHPIDDHKNLCDKGLSSGSKRLGFQTVFQSLYSSDAKPQIESKVVSYSKEIVLADKTVSNHGPEDNLNHTALGSSWITRLYPKTPSNSTNNASAAVGLKKLGEDKFTKPVALTSLEILKTPDEMDVRKYTRPTITHDNATHTGTTCFFCGKTGHGLRDCLEINKKELEDLVKNISLYEGVAKEAPCLCIKCFRLNHWASACPSKWYCSMIKTKASQSRLNFGLRENENVVSVKKVSNLNGMPRQLAPSSWKDKGKILGVPKEILDTIRRLRLSRTDILKWMNSHLPITNLDGFFVRLRLAKWEEGVGGAYYYVGCITGSQGENPSKGSKKPIHVNVGGVECLVESRYVSNCDFLEDELIAWWQKTSISGQVPVEEDLNSKLNERKRLGF